jgi:hypothetical protein
VFAPRSTFGPCRHYLGGGGVLFAARRWTIKWKRYLCCDSFPHVEIWVRDLRRCGTRYLASMIAIDGLMCLQRVMNLFHISRIFSLVLLLASFSPSCRICTYDSRIIITLQLYKLSLLLILLAIFISIFIISFYPSFFLSLCFSASFSFIMLCFCPLL